MTAYSDLEEYSDEYMTPEQFEEEMSNLYEKMKKNNEIKRIILVELGDCN